MSKKEKNIFGGGNVKSLYTPLSETEQETIARLIESNDLYIEVVEWGIAHNPRFVFGDARISCYFTMHFHKPEVPQVNHFFDLELKTRSGIVLFRERQPTIVSGGPIMIGAGMFLDLAWDIMIQQMDPALIKTLRPKVIGLTSRLDNMRLSADKQLILQELRESERRARQVKFEQMKRIIK